MKRSTPLLLLTLMFLASVHVFSYESDNEKAAPLTSQERKELPYRFAFRILASPIYEEDASIIELATKSEDAIVKRDEKPIAVWVNVPKNDAEQLEHNPLVVKRTTPATDTTEGKRLQVLAIIGENDLAGEMLVANFEGKYDSGAPNASPGIQFKLGKDAAERFQRLTKTNLPDPNLQTKKRCLAIILGGEVRCSPTINSVIGAEGIISFGPRPTAEALKELRTTIRGILKELQKAKASLGPVSESSTQ